MRPLLLFALAATILAADLPQRIAVTDRGDATGPSVLCIVAHPDDEIAFAGLLYKLATHLDGAADIATITNGEGGFKYSTLAEDLYGLELTNEAVGREHLPDIRMAELAAGTRFLHVRDLYTFREQDHRYSQDEQEVLAPDAGVWDLSRIAAGLDHLLREHDYDLVLTHLPTTTTHGHHKAATILALEAVQRLPQGQRPAILGASGAEPDAPLAIDYAALDRYADTAIHDPEAPLVFDRTQPFGHRDRLNYQIVVNWAIAEHKSQGTMQLAMSGGRIERYWAYVVNDERQRQRAAELFERLAEPQFEAKVYGASAGTNATPAPTPAP